MSKTEFLKPGNFIYPVPAVMVSCGSMEGEKNIISMDGDGMLGSSHGIYFRETGEVLISHS